MLCGKGGLVDKRAGLRGYPRAIGVKRLLWFDSQWLDSCFEAEVGIPYGGCCQRIQGCFGDFTFMWHISLTTGRAERMAEAVRKGRQ